MRAVTEADVCEGNSDERFLALPSIQKNTMKDNSSMLLYVTLNISILSEWPMPPLCHTVLS